MFHHQDNTFAAKTRSLQTHSLGPPPVTGNKPAEILTPRRIRNSHPDTAGAGNAGCHPFVEPEWSGRKSRARETPGIRPAQGAQGRIAFDKIETPPTLTPPPQTHERIAAKPIALLPPVKSAEPDKAADRNAKSVTAKPAVFSPPVAVKQVSPATRSICRLWVAARSRSVS